MLFRSSCQTAELTLAVKSELLLTSLRWGGGLIGGHFRKNLIPAGADLRGRAVSQSIADHLRFRRPRESEAASYNVLQRLAYLAVVFVLFPLMVWPVCAPVSSLGNDFRLTINNIAFLSISFWR